jgi:hypothetical protein
MRGRLRRPDAEQPLLTPVRIYVRDAVAAIGEHHRHVPEHPPRIVHAATLPRPRQRIRQRGRQPGPIGQLDQQRHPSMRHQPLSVRGDFYRFQPSRRLHHPGVLLGRDCRRQEPAFSRPGRTFPSARSARYRRFEAR